MKSNMSPSYNLRSSQRKRGLSNTNCYLQNLSENSSPEAFNPKVCLERLKLLECHDVQNSRFYLQKGTLKIKENKSNFRNKKYLLKVCCIVVLLLTSALYWRDYLQTNGIALFKKCSEIPPFQNFYIDVVKFQKTFLNLYKHKQQKTKKEDPKPIFQETEGNSTSVKDDIEIRQLVREYFVENKKKSKIQRPVKSPQSFIEEQCRADLKVNNTFAKKKVFDNVTFHNMVNLTDYALESEGAKIVTVFNTELYGIITVKYLNINLWPELSHFLMKHLSFSVNGPNSILMPWKKPGDCWAFKGSRGRVQIKLSDRITITAITVEHIPKEVSSKSAPKKFSLSGVEDSGNNDGVFLGSFEYDISGPAAQTFFIQPKVNIAFSVIEVSIESNHGNEKYTCVYKIRVHGHK